MEDTINIVEIHAIEFTVHELAALEAAGGAWIETFAQAIKDGDFTLGSDDDAGLIPILISAVQKLEKVRLAE